MTAENREREVEMITLLATMRKLGLLSVDTYIKACEGMDPMSMVQYEINHATSILRNSMERTLFGACYTYIWSGGQ